MAEAKKTEEKKDKVQGKDGVYYLVNPAGAIHNATRAHARERLALVGWRLADEDEIEAFKTTRVQRHDAPLCRPWSPDPDAQIELPE